MPIENPINKAYKFAHNRPEFTEELAEKIPDLNLTVLDTFSIPDYFMENETRFVEWFEPRFFKLDNVGIDEFSTLCMEAVRVIEEHKYILSPRYGKDWPLSKKTKQDVKGGFDSVGKIISFLKKVAMKADSDPKDFLTPTPSRKQAEGAEKLSVCRILSIAYILDHIKRSQDLDRFIEYSRFVLGRSQQSHEESGILSSLITSEPIDVLDKPNGKVDLINWLSKFQIIENCNLNNIGALGKKRSYYIPEFQIGFKSGYRAFLKVLRDQKAEFQPLDDFLRLRFVMKDDIPTVDMLSILSDLLEEAKTKKNIRVEAEIRGKNYLSNKELELYFPEIKSREEIEEIEEDMQKEELEKKRNDQHTARDIIKEKRDGIFPITIDRNVSSGKDYKNLSAKIQLLEPGSKKKYFAFEIQLLRKSELVNNEKLERRTSHFLFEMRQLAMTISRLNGIMHRDEIIKSFWEYMEQFKTEEMPKLLLGDAKYPEEYGSKTIEMSFVGSMNKKAEILFEFLTADGTLRHVAKDFPTKDIPPRNKRINSGLFIHETIMTRILQNLRYQKKELKKKKKQ